MKKIVKILNTRMTLVVTVALSQIIMAIVFIRLIANWYIVSVINFILQVLLILHIANKDGSSAFKFAWLIVVAVVPILGPIIYMLFSNRRVPKPLSKEFLESINESQEILSQNKRVISSLKDKDQYLQAKYVSDKSSYPCWKNTECKYYPRGEEFFEDMIEKIDNAKSFVFCEFFIVDKGYLFDKFKKAIINKAKSGIPVYFMYDDAGCLNLSKTIKKELMEAGINVTVFNPISLHLVLLSKSNNRDHRKICVVDNEYGYTGGYNLADEYINRKIVYGDWKDSGIRIRGNAVNNLTVMFIQFYNAHNQKNLVYKDFLLKNDVCKNTSIVLPFSDSPEDSENVSKNVHYNMIVKAKKYIYIQTPYLILDETIKEALINAKKSGVDVAITIPHVSDKKFVNMVTRNNSYSLVRQGIKVYEYIPGFVHSKMIIVDDNVAINGTINMDLRSYYLNYENGVLIFNDKEIKAMKRDYQKLLKSCTKVSIEEYNRMSFAKKLLHALMNIFSPLF